MKELLEKIRGLKGGIWLIILCLAGLVFISASLSSAADAQDMTALEQRISRTLSLIRGAGKCRITLYSPEKESAFSSASAPSGAVILAQGAGDVAVRLQLSQAAEALLGLTPDRIEIFQMEDAE